MAAGLERMYDTGVEIRRGYRYRLDLSEAQALLARRTAGCCRLVYNLALEQRVMWWRQGRRSVGYAEQCAQLVELKEAYPFLREVPSHTLQQALRDLDRAFRNFFTGTGRHPRYKGRGRHDAFRFPDPSQITVKGRHVRLPKLSWCALRLSRPIQGAIKNATVSWEAGHWYVSFSTVDKRADPVSAVGDAVGIDVGVAAAATLSTGASYGIGGWTEAMKRRRLRLERSIARKQRGSHNQRREHARLARPTPGPGGDGGMRFTSSQRPWPRTTAWSSSRIWRFGRCPGRPVGPWRLRDAMSGPRAD